MNINSTKISIKYQQIKFNNTSKRSHSPGQRPQPHQCPAFQLPLIAQGPIECYPPPRSETTHLQ